MASVTKSMTALCAHILIDRGELELEAPVAQYWPAFAQAGKHDILVRHAMAHYDGVLFSDAAGPGTWLDWEAVTAAIAAQPAEWPPGTQGAYNSFNYGFLVGEIIRRVSGRTVTEFFRDEVARPLAVDFQICLAEGEMDRVADVFPNPGSVSLGAFADPSTDLGRAWTAMPVVDRMIFNDREFRMSPVPSVSGHGNARAAARVFAMLARGGEIDGTRILSADAVRRATELQWEGTCGMTGRPYRMALGFFHNSPGMVPMGPNPDSFGHLGVGGYLAFADPDAQLAFSYCCNYMCAGAGVGERCEALVDAVFR